MENVESESELDDTILVDANQNGLQAGPMARQKSNSNANEFPSEDALETADTVSKTVRNYFPETWLYDLQLVK